MCFYAILKQQGIPILEKVNSAKNPSGMALVKHRRIFSSLAPECQPAAPPFAPFPLHYPHTQYVNRVLWGLPSTRLSMLGYAGSWRPRSAFAQPRPTVHLPLLGLARRPKAPGSLMVARARSSLPNIVTGAAEGAEENISPKPKGGVQGCLVVGSVGSERGEAGSAPASTGSKRFM